MKKVAARLGTILVVFALFVVLEISMPRQVNKIPQQVYAVDQPTSTPETPSVAPTAIPLVEAPTPSVLASTPCPSQDTDVTAHMLACTGHPAPYTMFEIQRVYDTNRGTVANPDWGYCKPGTLGCIAANQGLWSTHMNVNGDTFVDWSGFYFVPSDECTAGCRVYWPVVQ